MSPRTYPPAPGSGRRRATASRRPWSTAGVPRKSGSTARCGGDAMAKLSHAYRPFAQYQRIPAATRGGCQSDPHRRPLPGHRQSFESQESAHPGVAGKPPAREAGLHTPVGACWLNLQEEAWWRLFRREALAGESFADAEEIELATRVATKQLNVRAKPWVWGRPPKPCRHRRRSFVYHL